MSYDYNAIVQQFWKAREAAKEEDPSNWVEAVQAVESLSQHCPMTPLLWMQYAQAASHLSPELELQILQLGLLEFPGSAVLQLRAVTVAKNSDKDDGAMVFVVEQAISSVGRGSHRNQDGYVIQLYRAWLEKSKEQPEKVFIARSRVSMKHGNETLAEEAQEYMQLRKVSDYAAPEDDTSLSETMMTKIEAGCRWEARVLGSLSQFDDAVDATLGKQGIFDPFADSQIVDWDCVLENKNLHMGLGGFEVARAFIQYAKEAQRLRLKKEDAAEFSTHQLAFSIYERGVAECPTVESLWMNYIIDLMRSPEGIDLLLSVTERAVRNCPYSITLAQQRLYITEKLAAKQRIVVDPEELIQVAQACLDLKFLPPQASLELYMSAFRVVKRRILWLLAQGAGKKSKVKPLDYDDAEPLPRKESDGEAAPLTDETMEEISDLVADLREAYAEVEGRLPDAPSKAELRKDYALTETFMLSPLANNPFQPKAASALLNGFEKAYKTHQPPHPNISITYIHHYSLWCSVRGRKDVLTRMRRLRFLYQSSVERAGFSDGCNKAEFLESLKMLTRSWLEWESTFGSERSVHRAKQATQRKLEKFGHRLAEAEASLNPRKRVRQTESTVDPDVEVEEIERPTNMVKRQATLDTGNASVKTPGKSDETTTEESQKRKTVRVGTLEHPAHPFTIRVSNLSVESHDMDLVDLFRSKCGPVVHARILRHKDNGKSKGWGLVQFESSDSVEAALELNDVIGLKEKLVRIERSQLPAVSLVPAGQHRVNPKGSGRCSKRNEKRRSQKDDGEVQQQNRGTADKRNNNLLFQPRSVTRKQKAKVDLS